MRGRAKECPTIHHFSAPRSNIRVWGCIGDSRVVEWLRPRGNHSVLRPIDGWWSGRGGVTRRAGHGYWALRDMLLTPTRVPDRRPVTYRPCGFRRQIKSQDSSCNWSERSGLSVQHSLELGYPSFTLTSQTQWQCVHCTEIHDVFLSVSVHSFRESGWLVSWF